MTTIVLSMFAGNAGVDSSVLILLLLVAGVYLLVSAVRGVSRSIGLAGRLLGSAARAGIAFLLIAGAATVILLSLFLGL